MTKTISSTSRSDGTISVFGLGYVGTVTAACLSSRGFRLIGVDIQASKVRDVAAGRSPILEPEVDELLERACQRGLLSATGNTTAAVNESDISIVCVGTPATPSGGLNLDHVEKVTEEIAEALSNKSGSHLLIYRSTMPPGSVRKLVAHYLAELVEQQRLEVLFVPEFLREGTAVEDFRHPSLSIIGTIDGKLEDSGVTTLFDGCEQTSVVRWEEAEAVKYACNTFHAVKVAFANEIGRLCKANNIDGREVMNRLCDDSRLNISRYYLRPGNPFGGSCLPKDVAVLNSMAAMCGVNAPVLRSLRDSNREHQELLLERVLAAGSKRIGLLGLSFKSATDDLRNSPMVHLAESLLGKGIELCIFDPQLQLGRLTGSNEAMIAKMLPHLSRLLRKNVEDVLAEAEVLVISQRCVAFEVLESGVTDQHHVVDVNSWPELESLSATYDGLCWERLPERALVAAC